MANKHISYRQFKNIFGDLGVTYWTKYNWLSNGLPDGEYNGITKVTIDGSEENWNYFAGGKILFLRNDFVIPPVSSDLVWQYGFSNYEIGSRLSQDDPTDHVYMSVESSAQSVAERDRGAICIKFPNSFTSQAKMKEYLKEHPIILYYYDRNIWGGEIVNSVTAGQENLYYVSSDITNRAIRDVKGDFEGVSPMTSSELHDSPLDLVVCNNPSNRSIYFKDDSIGLNATEFNAKYCPRAIVYKLLPDPL